MAVTKKVFVPFSEALVEELGLSIGELVPFQLEYECLRMNESDGEIEEPEPLARERKGPVRADLRA